MPTFAEITGSRVVGQEGTHPVQGGMPYNPPFCIGRTKAGLQCTAPKAKGTQYCIGHLRGVEKNGN